MPYSTPPLVILISETDAGPFNWLSRNWPSLQKFYKHICLELCHDSSLDETISITNMAIKGAQEIIKQIKQAKSISDISSEQFNKTMHFPFHLSQKFFLEQIKEQKIPHTFIDFPKKTYFMLDQQSNIIGPNPYQLSLEKLKFPREKQMAQYIYDAAQKTNGGVVAIIGSNHYTVHEQIKKLDKNHAQYLYICIDQNHDLFLPESLSKETKKNILEDRLQRYYINVSSKINVKKDAKLLLNFHAADFTDPTKQKENDQKILEIIQNNINLEEKSEKEVKKDTTKTQLTDFDKVTFIKPISKEHQHTQTDNTLNNFKI